MNTGPQAQKSSKKQVITVIVTHSRPHGDEKLAIAMLMETSNHPFDLTKADIRLIRNDTDLDLYSDRKDVIFVGVGARLAQKCKGRVFDEHGIKDDSKCSADLVAEAVGVDGRLRAILEETRRHDKERVSAPMSLATVLKARYEQSPEAEVIAWGIQGARAIVRQALTGKRIDLEHKEEILGIASVAYQEIGQQQTASAKLSCGDFQKRVFEHTLPRFTATSQSGLPTDIGTIFLAMSTENTANAHKWLFAAAKDLVMEQIAFLNALDDFVARHERIVIANGIGGPVSVAFIKSDSHEMIRVFRNKKAGGYDVLIQRNSKGQVGIFTKQGNHPARGREFNLDPLARMVRWAEMSASRRTPHGWWKMGADGDCPDVEEWFYFKKGGSLMNGTKSRPGTLSTRLTDDDLAYIVRCAFSVGGEAMFMEENRVNEPRMSRVWDKGNLRPSKR